MTLLPLPYLRPGLRTNQTSSSFTPPTQVMQVNLHSVFTLCRDVGAHMLTLEPSAVTGRRGSIINLASLLTFQGGLTVPAYAASKGAVGQLTKSFANEWTARGVTVNAIAPGYIATDMNTALLNDPERLASINARIPAGRVFFLLSFSFSLFPFQVITMLTPFSSGEIQTTSRAPLSISRARPAPT